MRGEDISQPKLFITTTVTDFVPKSHPLRSLRKLLDAALRRMIEDPDIKCRSNLYHLVKSLVANIKKRPRKR